MKIKFLIGLLIGLLCVLPASWAATDLPTVYPIEPNLTENETNATEITEIELNESVVEELPNPGIGPDSIFYGLDIAIERIDLALTFNKAKRAEKGLEYAKERLAEVQEMIREKKIEAARIAQKAHDEELIEVEKEIEELSEENATEELKTVIELSEEVNIHKMIVEHMSQALIKIKGELTEEQQAMIDNIISSINNTTTKLKIEIQNKGEETKIKLKIQTGKTDQEIEAEIEELIEEYELERKGKSKVYKEKKEKEIEIEDEEIEIGNETEVKISGDVEISTEVQATIDALLTSLKNVEGEIELRLQIEKEGNETLIEAEIEKGTLNQEQLALWETLQNQVQELIKSSEGNKLEIEIQHELEIEIEKEEKVQCTTDSDCENYKFCDEGVCEDIEEVMHDIEDIEEYEDLNESKSGHEKERNV